MRRRRVPWLVVAAVIVVGAASCSEQEATATARADELVAEARSTGVAPDLDAEVAISLYGDDAPTVCGPLEDDPVNITTWSRVNRGMPDTLVDELIRFDRLVIDVYCPDQHDRFDELLDELHHQAD